MLTSSIAGDISPLRNQQQGVHRLTNNQGFSPKLADFIFNAAGASVPFQVPELEDVPGSRPLNPGQRKAVAKALAAPDLCLVQGPPGTGKTTVIADICLRATHDGLRVLVASQTNLAVDNALARLADAPGIRPLRLGKTDKVDPEYQDYLAENVITRWFSNIAEACRRRADTSGRAQADLLARERGATDLGAALAAVTEAHAALARSQLEVSRAREERQRTADLLKQAEHALDHASREAMWLRETARWAADGGPLPATAASEPWPPVVALARCLFGIVPTLAAIDRLCARRDPLQDLLNAVESARSVADGEAPEVQELQALRAEKRRLVDSIDDEELNRLRDVNKAIRRLEEQGWNQVTGKIGRASADVWGSKVPDCIRVVVEALGPSPLVEEELRRAHVVVTAELATTNAADECVMRSAPVWLERADAAELEARSHSAILASAREQSDRSEDRLRRALEGEQRAQQGVSAARALWDAAWGLCWPGVPPAPPNGEAVTSAAHEVADERATSGASIARAARWQVVQSEWLARLNRTTESDREHLQALYVRHSNVVGMTCNEAGARRTWQDPNFKPFDIVIVDEVSKATPPELILPLLLGKKAVLVGDHRQLPPMFREQEASFGEAAEEGEIKKEDFERIRKMVTASLFEELFASAPEATKATLWTQYRMHPRIMDAVNEFYEGRLEAGLGREELARARQHHLTIEDDAGGRLLEPTQNLLWIDTSQKLDGKPAWEQQEGSSKSNPLEVDVVVAMLARIGDALRARGYGKTRFVDVPAQPEAQTWEQVARQAMSDLPAETLADLFAERRVRVDGRATQKNGTAHPGARMEVQRQKEVGVITFYGAQLKALRRAIDAQRGKRPDVFAAMEIRTNTVDRFQGMEKPIVIVSLVRAKRGALGSFVREFQRINVGLSRAQQLLVVVGAEDTWKQAAIPMPPLAGGPPVEVRAYQRILELTLAKQEGGALPAKSSPLDEPALVWLTTQVWWPLERIPVILEVVHPRSLTALEWVLLRVADEFRAEVPSLSEVAVELGLADRVFLRETLEDVVRQRALTPNDPGGSWDDLGDLSFTPDGLRLFRAGKIEGLPAHPGVTFHFDALTGEACSEPADTTDVPKAPFGGGRLAVQPRSGIGHDRAREVVERFHRDVIKGGGEVRSADVHPTRSPSVVWAPVTVKLTLLDSDHLVPSCEQLTDKGVAVLKACRPVEDGLVPAEPGAPDGHDAHVRPVIGWEEWRRLAARTLARGADAKRVLQLLMKPPREVWLHHAWLELPSMKQRLESVARGGGRVVVLGSPSTEVALHAKDPTKLGVIVLLTAGQSLPAALLFDKQTGFVRGDVALTYGERGLPTSLVGELDAQGCKRMYSEFRSAIDEGLRGERAGAGSLAEGVTDDAETNKSAAAALDDIGVKLAISRLVLFGSREDLPSAARSVADVVDGLARIEALSQLGTLAKRAIAEVSDEEAYAPARAAWEEQVLERPSHEDLRQTMLRLAQLAPPGAPAAELVQLAIGGAPSLDRDPQGVVGFLTELRDCVDARWGTGTAANIEAFSRYRDAVLEPNPDPAWGVVPRASAARQLLSAAELHEWVVSELADLPRPLTLSAFDAFVDVAAALQLAAPRRAEGVVQGHLRALAGMPDADIVALVRVAARVLSVTLLFDALLTTPPALDELAAARATLIAAGSPVEPLVLQARLESALPAPQAQLTASSVAAALQALTQLGQLEPGTRPTGRAWANKVAAAKAAPKTPEELVEWMSELKELLPLLDDAPSLVRGHVVRLREPIRAARAGREPVWVEIRKRWAELGLAEVMLSGLLEPASGPSAHKPPPAGQKKKGNRR